MLALKFRTQLEVAFSSAVNNHGRQLKKQRSSFQHVHKVMSLWVEIGKLISILILGSIGYHCNFD